ncbi:AI-2E family transporter [Serpentinicella sp. ANB-PHB4]|uniref:AI-2E family transporter n=1 Tax=Serpentinicella sp. ANB-PHB4 TaxID=3074076 RepID=UPI00285CEEDE|nr:AI-2E family transporter [Serpentinicella sp. ANB-PHB4]MDR5658451.1 AI-2E family transporter [Serpentinicella sp. ANB-PHB4]
MYLSNRKRNVLLDVLLFSIVAILIFLIRDNIMNVVTPFIYALVVAFLLNPIVNLIERKGIKRIFAILIVFLVIILIISAVFATFMPRLTKDLSIFARDIPQIFATIERFVVDFRTGELGILPDWSRQLFDFDIEMNKVSEVVRNSFNQLSAALLSSTGALLDIIMTPIIAFYYLKDKDKLTEFFMQYFSEKRANKIKEIGREINKVLGGFIRGQLLVATFVGILTGLGCWFIGVPYAMTIGLVAGITNIIPYFGPWIGGILPVVLALMNNPITAIWVTIWIIVVQQIESSFISPQIMSNSVGLHPLNVIFSVLLFGNIFGIPGMIIAVPLTGTIKVFIKFISEYRRAYREKNILTSDSNISD